MTACSVEAWAGGWPRTSSSSASGSTVPPRTRSWLARTTERTSGRPRRISGSRNWGLLRTMSVAGTERRGSASISFNPLVVAEADGNRTRLAGVPGHTDFEDQGDHQAPIRLRSTAYETHRRPQRPLPCRVRDPREAALRCALQPAPAPGAIVGDDVTEHRGQRGPVDDVALAHGDGAGCLVVVAGGDDSLGIRNHGAVIEKDVDVVPGRQQSADVALQDEVRLDAALDGLGDLWVGAVDQVADLSADPPLPRGQCIDVGVDAAVRGVAHGLIQKPVSPAGT